MDLDSGWVNSWFDRSYLAQVNSPVLRADKHLFVYRSKQVYMKYVEERMWALEAVIALLRNMKSGRIENAYLKRRINR